MALDGRVAKERRRKARLATRHRVYRLSLNDAYDDNPARCPPTRPMTSGGNGQRERARARTTHSRQ